MTWVLKYTNPTSLHSNGGSECIMIYYICKVSYERNSFE